jgi:hypothetical protein
MFETTGRWHCKFNLFCYKNLSSYMDCVDNDKLIPRIDLSIKCTDNGNNYYFDTKLQVQDPVW